MGGGGALCARMNTNFYLQLFQCLKVWKFVGLFPALYVLPFGAKIRIFVEGGAPFWPLQKNVISKEEKILRLIKLLRFERNACLLLYNV
jgi:hypothetical protein